MELERSFIADIGQMYAARSPFFLILPGHGHDLLLQAKTCFWPSDRREMDALIGHTGFVGGNLARAHTFEAKFNSSNIEEARGHSFNLLVCSGVRAEKWIANREGEKDLQAMQKLLDVLASVEVRIPVLISTTDVYGDTRGRTELDPADEAGAQPYGRNRAYFERVFQEKFPNALVLRLPGLFGPGLKKNVIHDLINDHEVEKINTDGIHQYYDVRWLWKDIVRSLSLGIRKLNICSPPIQVEELCAAVFGLRLQQPGPGAPAYDMRSMHAQEWGRSDGYLYGKKEVLKAMKEFVTEQRALRT